MPASRLAGAPSSVPSLGSDAVVLVVPAEVVSSRTRLLLNAVDHLRLASYESYVRFEPMRAERPVETLRRCAGRLRGCPSAG